MPAQQREPMRNEAQQVQHKIMLRLVKEMGREGYFKSKGNHIELDGSHWLVKDDIGAAWGNTNRIKFVRLEFAPGSAEVKFYTSDMEDEKRIATIALGVVTKYAKSLSNIDVKYSLQKMAEVLSGRIGTAIDYDAFESTPKRHLLRRELIEYSRSIHAWERMIAAKDIGTPRYILEQLGSDSNVVVSDAAKVTLNVLVTDGESPSAP